MNMSNNTIRIYITLSSFSIFYGGSAIASEADARNKFIEVGAEYEHSDNIYKLPNRKKDGTTTTAGIELGYKQSKANNRITLNYYAEHSETSEAELQSNSYWVGNSAISQDVFSKNLLFNLEHTRQRYLIDQTKTGLDSNQDERDLLTAGLQWLIPYSPRVIFILGATHTQTWFKKEKINDNSTNEGQVSLQYAFDDISQIQLSYFRSQNKFDDFDYTYDEHNLDVSLTRQYLLGNYAFNAGGNWVDTSSEKYDGYHYGFTIDARRHRHLFIFNASQVLTNTSAQVGTDDELDFSKNQLFYRTNISLQQQYTSLDERLLSTIRLYYDNDDAITSIDGSDIGDQDRYGAYVKLSWSFTHKLSANLFLNYYNAELSTSDTKKFVEAKIGSRYNLNSSIYIQFTVSFEKQNSMQNSAGYEEKNYATRIAFRY
ncbi:hypothetical protein HWV01_12545 [Moritella sp. 5]|uniref:hypothetical protein n=1 Tax=Moritella sp. 5 TaxID=2746231 RepID=UPI001BA505D8|nr:hypothetical protein [Moritella sp. 5]QUM81051.1 hypothetical protein HWV01_12545 [Moritella sp. 5]